MKNPYIQGAVHEAVLNNMLNNIYIPKSTLILLKNLMMFFTFRDSFGR